MSQCHGHCPCLPMGAAGIFPWDPHSSGGFTGSRGPEPHSWLSCLGEQQPWTHWHTFCQPHQCPTPVSHGTGEQGQAGGPGK